MAAKIARRATRAKCDVSTILSTVWDWGVYNVLPAVI